MSAVASFFTTSHPKPEVLKEVPQYNPALIACTAIPVIGMLVEMMQSRALLGSLPDLRNDRIIEGTRKNVQLIDAKLYTMGIYKTVGIGRSMIVIAMMICTMIYYKLTAAAQLAYYFFIGWYTYHMMDDQSEISKFEKIRNQARPHLA